MLGEPFYDPNLSFDANTEQGPFGTFAHPIPLYRDAAPAFELFGFPLYQPFGIPAGPVMNARFAEPAFRMGFDIVVYKTVRSNALDCHPWPNILAVELDAELTPERAKEPVVALHEFRQPLSITNSFGVPSPDPQVWQTDMTRAVELAGRGQLLIGSFQGTRQHDGTKESFVADYIKTAQLTAETGVQVLETNLSCPNEGTNHLVCFNLDTTEQIVRGITAVLPTHPLVIKIAYFGNQEELRTFVKRIGPLVAGIEAINTIPVAVVTAAGEQALPGDGRRVSGICGAAIKWAGLDMVRRLVALRDELGLDYRVMGVGGVTNPADYIEYRSLGADAVLSATGSIWNPNLAREIWQAFDYVQNERTTWQTTSSAA